MADHSIIGNRYRIKRELGQGGMGIVYLTEDILMDNMLFAIKTVKQEIIKRFRKHSIDAFKNEYEVMTRLKHPNLTRVYDFGEYEDNYYIVMEYLQGELLSEYSMRDDKKKIDIIIQVLRALGFIHSRNIVYRDAKPGNIMILPETVKLLDFGLSSSAVNKDDKIRGTLTYASPEILTGSVDHLSDIFGFGIVFYEMITGGRFYESRTGLKNIIQILEDKIDFNAFKNKRLEKINDTALKEIIDKMISYYKADRYETCTEIIGDINNKLKLNYEFETKETRRSYVLGNSFANRKVEYDFLLNSLTFKDSSKVILYRGPAGIGKTRLFDEFKKYCRLNDISFFDTSCKEGDLLHYKSIKDILSQLIVNSSKDLLLDYGKYLKLILPFNERLKEFQAPYIKDDPRLLRDIIVQNLTDYIIAFSRNNKKTVVYIDDGHWIDDGSRDIILELLKKIKNTNDADLLIYLSIIDNNMENVPAFFSSADLSFPLKPLDDDGVRELIYNIFGPLFVGDCLKSAINKMRDKVGGNPLLLLELIKSLIENELIIKTEDSWDLIKPFDEINIPQNIIELIKKKLDTVFTDQNKIKILKILSLLRIDLSVYDIKYIIHKLYDLDPGEILLDLENNEIIRSNKKDNIIYYRYTSSLIKEQINRNISDRIKVSDLLAQALESCQEYSKDDFTEEIAYQYQMGKNYQKAIIFYEKCGDIAKENYLNEKAIQLYETTLKLMKKLLKIDQKKIILLKQKLGIVYDLMGNYIKSEKLYDDCINYSESINDNELLASSYLSKGDLLFSKGELNEALKYFDLSSKLYGDLNNEKGIIESWKKMGNVFYLKSDYSKSLKYYEDAGNIAQDKGYIKESGKISGNIGHVYKALGNYQKALEFYKKDMKLANESGEKRSIAMTAGNTGLAYLAMGEYTQAIEYLMINLNIAEDIGHKRGYGIASVNLGIVYKELGDYDKALKHYELYRKISEELGDKRGIGVSNGNIGMIYYYQGKYKKAIECNRIFRDIAEEIGAKKAFGGSTGNMGMAYEALGEYDKALKAYEIYRDISEEIGFKKGAVDASIMIGDLYYYLSDFNNALKHFEKAQEIIKEPNIDKMKLLECLSRKSMTLLNLKRLKEAEASNERAFDLSEELEDEKLILRARIQKILISISRNKTSIEKIKELLESADELLKAEVYYELYDLLNKESFRIEAEDLYISIYNKTPEERYRKRIEKLAGERN